MKFVILGDIHGNIDALKECIKAFEKNTFDAIIMCGDYVTDFPNGHEVIKEVQALINKYKCYIIKGNRDQYIIDYRKGKKFNIKQLKNIEYTYNSLTKGDVDWLESLPEYIEININNKKIYISHRCSFDKKYDYIVYGHNHTQENYIKDNITYINPGSVGITTDGKIGAEYSILEISNNKEKIEDHLIRYDMEKVINKIRKASIYNDEVKWGRLLEKELITGQDYPLKCIEEYEKIRNERHLTEESLEAWNIALKNVLE